MLDDKLAREEAYRAEKYEDIKSGIKNEVGQEIMAEAERPTRNQVREVDDLAVNMREKAVKEIASTENEVELGRSLARVSQVIDYVFFIIYGLLTIRLLLALFAARSSADFVQFIFTITDPFYAPFKGIVPSPSVDGFTLALPIVVALVVYLLLHLAINGFLRIFVHRKTTV